MLLNQVRASQSDGFIVFVKDNNVAVGKINRECCRCEGPIGDSTLIEDLDGARVQTASARVPAATSKRPLLSTDTL
jgi:hypothetical protein